MKYAKRALMVGAASAVLGGAALLIGKLVREKKLEQELWDVDEDGDTEIEFTMFAGDIDVEEDEQPVEFPELEVVKVVLTGPRTARVRPTEEEEKEMLRKKLETVIRY